jgi:hypothetical protein
MELCSFFPSHINKLMLLCSFSDVLGEWLYSTVSMSIGNYAKQADSTNIVFYFGNVTEYLSRIGSCEASAGADAFHPSLSCLESPSSLVWGPRAAAMARQWCKWMEENWRNSSNEPVYIHFCLLYSLLLERWRAFYMLASTTLYDTGLQESDMVVLEVRVLGW